MTHLGKPFSNLFPKPMKFRQITNTNRETTQIKHTCPPPNAQTEMMIQWVQETTETMTVHLEPSTNPPLSVEHVTTLTQVRY